MKKLFIALALFASTAFAQSVDATDPNIGVVVGKMPGAADTGYIKFFNYPTVADPQLATTAYALSSFGQKLQNPLSLSGIKGANKVWLSMYDTGTGHKDGVTTLSADSQYMLIGGKEYGAGAYRGIGFGYVQNSAAVAPVFVGAQDSDTSADTNADLIFATRATTGKKDMPAVRMRITSQGAIKAGADYKPTDDQDLVTKAHMDAAIKAAIDALQKADQ